MYDPPRVYEGKITPFSASDGARDERGRAMDPVGYLEEMQQRAREKAVAIEAVKLARQDVIKCYRKEGVNHYENCKEVVKKYVNMIQAPDYGALKPQTE